MGQIKSERLGRQIDVNRSLVLKKFAAFLRCIYLNLINQNDSFKNWHAARQAVWLWPS